MRGAYAYGDRTSPDQKFDSQTFKEGMKMQAVNTGPGSLPLAEGGAKVGTPAYQAYRILQFAFIVAPIVAGLDKFFHLLVNWDQYLPPAVNRMEGGDGHAMMLAAGGMATI